MYPANCKRQLLGALSAFFWDGAKQAKVGFEASSFENYSRGKGKCGDVRTANSYQSPV